VALRRTVAGGEHRGEDKVARFREARAVALDQERG